MKIGDTVQSKIHQRHEKQNRVNYRAQKAFALFWLAGLLIVVISMAFN